MIKQAKNETDYTRCIEFLGKWDLTILPDTALFYIEHDQKITAVSGWNVNLGAQIEPFASESVSDTYKLFYFMIGYIKGLGFKYVTAQPMADELQQQMLKIGFQVYLTNSKLIMEI